jgi:hypothetical protein
MVAMESLLEEEQVLSCQTTLRVHKRLNFWSDRLITPEFLQEFLEAIFLVEPMESLLCEAKVQSRHTRVTAQKGSNFWSDRWIVLKFLL